MANWKIIGAIVALIFAILFFIAGVVVLPVLYETLETSDSDDDYQYGIVVDAGSSHTTMYFCRWPVPKYKGTGEVEEIHDCDMDSLSSFTDDPDKAGGIFDACLEESYEKNYIPEDERNTTQIFLGATAGMRLVDRINHSVSEQIFSSVNATLEKSEYKLSSGRIITGQEEAVSGWTIVNYLGNRLQQPDIPVIGALDLGGASTQITFPHSTVQHSEYESTVNLFDEKHTLYARSYLCYGQDQARLRFLAHLINSTMNATENGTVEVDNPCLLGESRITLPEDEIFDSVCVRTDTSSEIFGYGYSRPRRSSSFDEAVNYTFVGTADPKKCNESIYELFDLTRCSDPTVCINSTYFWPPVNDSGMYLGMSAYYFNANFFNFSGIVLKDLTNYSNYVHEFCAQSNATVYPQHKDDRFLQRYCFGGPYSLFLLQNGFGFNHSNVDWSLMFLRKVDGMSVEWALGYMINQTTGIPDDGDSEESSRPFSAVWLGVGVALLIIACVVCLIVFFILCWRGMRNREYSST